MEGRVATSQRSGGIFWGRRGSLSGLFLSTHWPSLDLAETHRAGERPQRAHSSVIHSFIYSFTRCSFKQVSLPSLFAWCPLGSPQDISFIDVIKLKWGHSVFRVGPNPVTAVLRRNDTLCCGGTVFACHALKPELHINKPDMAVYTYNPELRMWRVHG